VRAIWRASALHASQVRAASIRDSHHDVARRHGYPDIIALLRSTTGLTARAVAELIGFSGQQITKLRTRHHIPPRHTRGRSDEPGRHD